jgi:hypothetical protein
MYVPLSPGGRLPTANDSRLPSGRFVKIIVADVRFWLSGSVILKVALTIAVGPRSSVNVVE